MKDSCAGLSLLLRYILSLSQLRDNFKKMKIINYIKNNIWLSTLIIFCLFFVTYGSIYFFIDGISFPDDHFFHIKIAKLLANNGWRVINDFNWYPIKDGRLDLSLFQISLIPFTFFSNLLTGLRVSDVFWAALSLAVVYFSLRKFKFKYSFLILLIIFSSSHLSNRLFLGRGFILTFGLVLLELYFAQKKKYVNFFWVSLFHILWHRSLLFFPPVIFFAVEISRYLVVKKVKWNGLLASLGAVTCGMFFYPNFPMNMFDWMMGLFRISTDISSGVKLEGSELYTKNGLGFFTSFPIFSLFAIISVVLVIYFYVKSKEGPDSVSVDRDEDLLRIFSFFLMLIVFILGSMVVSGRFFDYYFILLIILFASILEFSFRQKEVIFNEKILKYTVVACFIFFSYLSLDNYLELRLLVAKSGYKTIKAPVEWIRDNSEKGELIYLVNWSNFPEAFFYNDKNIYSWGIEPKVLNNRDPKLFWKAYNILAYGFYCEHQVDCEDEYNEIIKKIQELEKENKKEEVLAIRKENSRKIINSIKNDFGARFILSSDNASTERIELSEDLIADKFESVSEKDPNSKITAFRLK